MHRSLFLFLTFFLATRAVSLFSTTIIPHIHLGEAARYSQAVVVARVEYLIETTENGTTYFDARLQTEEVLKGPFSKNQEITVRALSNRTGDFSMDIAGDFIPEAGATYLLLLEQHGAVWRPRMLSYYVFEQKMQQGELFWVPVSMANGIETVERPDGQLAAAPCVYKATALLQCLKNHLTQVSDAWNDREAKTTTWQEGVSDRVLPTGCDFQIGTAPLTRWQNPSYSMYYDSDGIPPNWTTNFAAVLNMLNTNYSVGITNGGMTSFNPNCIGGSATSDVTGNNFPTFINSLNGSQSGLIIFDDPCNQLGSITNCVGVLGAGGSYRSGSTHVYDGQNWYDAYWAFVIVNDGVSCLSDIDLQKMMAHEITHTYRMDHLNATLYPNQNMNQLCCNTIAAKDIECMNYAYNNAPALVELVSFNAKAIENRQVKLLWETASEKHNDFYTLESSVDGIRFAPLAKISAGPNNRSARYEWTDQHPANGLNYYRLSQTDQDGTRSILGVKTVQIEGQRNTLQIYPNPAVDNLAIHVNFTDAFEGTLEITDANGHVLSFASLQLEKGTQVIQQPVAHFPSGTYFVRLRDAHINTIQKFVKQY